MSDIAKQTRARFPIFDELFPGGNLGAWRNRIQGMKLAEFNDSRKAIFLEALLKSGKIVLAATAAGVTERTVQHHKGTDEEFAELLALVLAGRSKTMVQMIEEDAIRGHEQKHFDRDGNLISETVRYETGLRKMILERYEPEYRTKADLNVNVRTSGVLVAPQPVNADDWGSQAEAVGKGQNKLMIEARSVPPSQVATDNAPEDASPGQAPPEDQRDTK